MLRSKMLEFMMDWLFNSGVRNYMGLRTDIWWGTCWKATNCKTEIEAGGYY